MIRRIDQGPIGPGGISDPPATLGGDVPPFHPDLGPYSGPLDLLLYLIQKNEVDVFDIPIASILEQYLQHLAQFESNGHIDLAHAGAFLVMATRLMEIKSRLLLPTPEALDGDEPLEEELEDPRLSLVQQLLEYKEIKERAVLLEKVHRERQARFGRAQAEIWEDPEQILELGDVSILDLWETFRGVLIDLDHRRSNVRIIELDDISVEDVIQTVCTHLRGSSHRAVSFRDLFRSIFEESGYSMGALIGYFLALLEMARLRLVRIEQDPQFGSILLRFPEHL